MNDGDLAVTSLSLQLAVTVLRAQPAAAGAVCDKACLLRLFCLGCRKSLHASGAQWEAGLWGGPGRKQEAGTEAGMKVGRMGRKHGRERRKKGL